MFVHANRIEWGFVVFAAFMVLPLPAYIVFSMVADLNDVGSSSVATARAERAYKQAIEDKEGLAGGLALDEHARREGGELTMQQEAGGLAVREEVAFDFAEERAEVAAEQEVAARSTQ